MTTEIALDLVTTIYRTHAQLRPEPHTIANGETVVRLLKKWHTRWVVVYILWSVSDWHTYLANERKRVAA